jgi:hypothetical protein
VKKQIWLCHLLFCFDARKKKCPARGPTALKIAKAFPLHYSEIARLPFHHAPGTAQALARRVSAMLRKLVFVAIIALVLVLLSAAKAE